MKIALIKPPGTYAFWFKQPMLGISYISSCLERSGFECKIFDADFNTWSERTLLEKVRAYNPDVVGITSMTHDIVAASRIAYKLKMYSNIPIIIGGCHVTALPYRTLEEFPMFDYGVFGEGEITMQELLQCLSENNNYSLELIHGLVFRKGKNIILNQPRPFLTSQEINELPFPTFKDYYEKNKNALSGKNKYYVVITSRGCPFNCVFCMRVLGQKIRRRSPENVCDEIEFAISAYGAHTIVFLDEIFLFNDAETRVLLNMMINRGLSKKIKWAGFIRANFVTSELIYLAKQAGCYHLEMGVESGDDEILKVIEKRISIEQIRKAVKIIKEARISLCTLYILGHPNETRDTVRKTVELAIELNTDDIAVGLMVPYPGTKIYEMALNGQGGYRLLSHNWSDFDKYCSKVLELNDLSYQELSQWQRTAFIGLYLKNRRFIDALKFFWKIRRALGYIFMKWMAGLQDRLGRSKKISCK